jgi:quercetin dioxygenase-like cupin family protein
MHKALMSLGIAAIFGIAAATAHAQTDAPPRAQQTPYQTTDLAGDPTRQVMLYSNVFSPGAGNPFHTHNGDQWVIVQEGELVYTIKGQEPRLLKAGDSVYTPRGTVHRSQNLGDKPARTLELLISDKGKPRIETAP